MGSSVNKYDFMVVVKDILEDTSDENLVAKGKELKVIIDKLVVQEIQYANAGIR